MHSAKVKTDMPEKDEKQLESINVKVNKTLRKVKMKWS